MNQFLRFAVAGVIGFLVDASVLRLLVSAFNFNLYSGRFASYLCAASVTWYLNRRFTFRNRAAPAAQWLRFVLVNTIGAGANLGVYALMVGMLAVGRAFPTLAVAAGSLAGMCLNFTLMKKLVFR
jgi:putative flippase GtrA